MNKLNKDLGSYMPAFFYMKLEFQYLASMLTLFNLRPKDKATFVHEYIHYLQDISTHYGLNNAYVYSEYIHSAVNEVYKNTEKEIVLPVKLKGNFSNVALNEEINRLCEGDYCEIPTLFITKIEEREVPVSYSNPYLSRLKLVYLLLPKGRKVQFGARSIMESMAYLMEKCIEPKCASADDYPYHSAEHVVSCVYPEFGEDIYRLIALCDISLNCSNPGKLFLQTLRMYKERNQLPSPEQLYKDFYNAPCELMGQQNQFIPAFMSFAFSVAERLVLYLNDASFAGFHCAVRKMIGGAIELRIKHPSFMIDIAKGGDITKNDTLQRIMMRLGSPIICDCKNNYSQIPSAYFDDSEFRYFVAIEQVYKTLNDGCDCCDMIEWCDYPDENGNKTVDVDERCFDSPWERSSDQKLCPYAILWKHWNLAKRKVINPLGIKVK